MAYKSKICYVCHSEGPSQSHHLLPLEYGGPKDGPQIDVCPKCHLSCHYEAESFYKNSEYLNLETMFSGAALGRALQVIGYIVKQKSKFEAENKPAIDARRTVNLSFSHEELQLLHAAKSVMKFKNVQRFIKSCIQERLWALREKGKL